MLLNLGVTIMKVNMQFYNLIFVKITNKINWIIIIQKKTEDVLSAILSIYIDNKKQFYHN